MSSGGNQVVKKPVRQTILDDSEDDEDDGGFPFNQQATNSDTSDNNLVIDEQNDKEFKEIGPESSPVKSSVKRIVRRTIVDDSDSEDDGVSFMNRQVIEASNKKKNSSTSNEKAVARKSILEDSDNEFSNGEIDSPLKLELPMSDSDTSGDETKETKKSLPPMKVLVDAADESSNSSEIMKSRKPKRRSGIVSNENSSSSILNGKIFFRLIYLYTSSEKMICNLFRR